MKTRDLLQFTAETFHQVLAQQMEREERGNLSDPEDLFQHLTYVTTELRRTYLSRRIHAETGGVVQHGLLEGFFIGDLATWCSQDDAGKLLGFYEEEVCDLLANLCQTRDIFVDLGGADGFYAVGTVATGHFRESHCYELVDASRANIGRIAERAGVADRVHLYGAATDQFPLELVQNRVQLNNAVVLIDIEGAEFDVLTDACLCALRDAHVIVEVHDFLVADGAARLAALLERASRVFDVTTITTGARNPGKFPMLHAWSDTDRWLLCSETRGRKMNWLHLQPTA